MSPAVTLTDCSFCCCIKDGWTVIYHLISCFVYCSSGDRMEARHQTDSNFCASTCHLWGSSTHTFTQYSRGVAGWQQPSLRKRKHSWHFPPKPVSGGGLMRPHGRTAASRSACCWACAGQAASAAAWWNGRDPLEHWPDSWAPGWGSPEASQQRSHPQFLNGLERRREEKNTVRLTDLFLLKVTTRNAKDHSICLYMTSKCSDKYNYIQYRKPTKQSECSTRLF